MLDTPDETRLESLLLAVPSAGAALRCANCGQLVTREEEAIEAAGAHVHDFSNPAGLRFRIGCFGAAPGAAVRGKACREWSWFEAHAWRIALCRGCGVQIGWRFVGAEGGGFFGLILNALVADSA